METNTSGIPYNPAAVAITGGNVAFNVLQGGIPIVKTPSGTMSNNGAFVSGTAFPVTFAEGAYFWFTANQIAAGVAAGLYWGVASSTTAVTIFNSTYTSGLPATGVATAFATTGPGATTGDTGTVTALSFTVPAMGINARYDTEVVWTVNNSAGSKNMTPRYAGSNVNSTNVTTQNAVVSRAFFQNRGRTDKQVVGLSTLMSVGSGSGGGQLSLDTSIAQTGLVFISTAVATDYAILENYAFKILTP